jgi:hypothetical protein
VVPIVEKAAADRSGGAGATVFASALSIANAGVAVVDAGLLPTKAQRQLAEALQLAVR